MRESEVKGRRERPLSLLRQILLSQQIRDARINVVVIDFCGHLQGIPNRSMIAGAVTNDADTINTQQRRSTGLLIMELIGELPQCLLRKITLR